MEKMTGHGVGWEDGTFSCSRPRRMFCVRRNNSVVLRTRRGRGRGRRRKSAWPLLHYVSGSGTSTSTSFSFWLMKDSVPIRRSPHPAVPPFGQPSPQPVGSQSIAYATGVSTAPREETSVIFRMSPAAYALLIIIIVISKRASWLTQVASHVRGREKERGRACCMKCVSAAGERLAEVCSARAACVQWLGLLGY
ncbi:hypothetical protein GGS24DRAFT_335684 [Hypoxylon argillaceum]|nr:hypothetical protein GGS24DRAFT_335684 [Hypoxylon argillaceum]